MRRIIQMVLVSREPTPNLLAALDATPGHAPDHVVLVVTPHMTEQANHLERTLRQAGRQTSRLTIADAWNLADIEERICNWLAEQDLNDCIQLNATGGTKLMSLAAAAAFQLDKRDVFYVHVERDELVWIEPRQRPPRSLEPKLSLSTYLAAHGVRLTHADTGPVATTCRRAARSDGPSHARVSEPRHTAAQARRVPSPLAYDREWERGQRRARRSDEA